MADIVPEVKISVRIPKRLFDGRGIIDRGVQETRDKARDTLLRVTKQVFREKRGPRNQDLIATGQLYRALKARLQQSGSGWYKIGVTAEGEAEKYLPYVESGMPPGTRINRAGLLRWMEARGINEAAFSNIAKSLRKKGYKGRYPMREAQSRIRPITKRVIETAVNRAVKRWLEG